VDAQAIRPEIRTETSAPKRFAKPSGGGQAGAVTQPLALVLYERVMPGSQLANRLQDLGYRVQTCSNGAALAESVGADGPMLIVADLQSAREDVCALIGKLKQDAATRHIPVLAFASDEAGALQEAALHAGSTLVVSDAAVMNHLPQLLDQALHIE
jgi:CheY-like chemotaxis protein